MRRRTYANYYVHAYAYLSTYVHTRTHATPQHQYLYSQRRYTGFQSLSRREFFAAREDEIRRIIFLYPRRHPRRNDARPVSVSPRSFLIGSAIEPAVIPVRAAIRRLISLSRVRTSAPSNRHPRAREKREIPNRGHATIRITRRPALPCAA